MLEPLLLKVWTIIFVFKKRHIPQEIKTLIAGTHFSIPLIPLLSGPKFCITINCDRAGLKQVYWNRLKIQSSKLGSVVIRITTLDLVHMFFVLWNPQDTFVIGLYFFSLVHWPVA